MITKKKNNFKDYSAATASTQKVSEGSARIYLSDLSAGQLALGKNINNKHLHDLVWSFLTAVG